MEHKNTKSIIDQLLNEEKQEQHTETLNDILDLRDKTDAKRISIYIYNQETTVYQETEDMDTFLEILLKIEKETSPSCFFLHIEKRYKKNTKNSVIIGHRLDSEECGTETTKTILTTIKEKKHTDLNLKLSCTFFYSNHQNTYQTNKTIKLEVKEIDKRKDIFTGFSYTLKFLATVVNLKNVPQLEKKLTIESRRALESGYKLVIVSQKK